MTCPSADSKRTISFVTVFSLFVLISHLCFTHAFRHLLLLFVCVCIAIPHCCLGAVPLTHQHHKHTSRPTNKPTRMFLRQHGVPRHSLQSIRRPLPGTTRCGRDRRLTAYACTLRAVFPTHDCLSHEHRSRRIHGFASGFHTAQGNRDTQRVMDLVCTVESR